MKNRSNSNDIISYLAKEYERWNADPMCAEYCRNDVMATEAAFKNINKGNLQMGAIMIEKVIKNDDAVIVLWSDKTKTVVKLMDGDTDDIYSAVAQAIAKKIYGGTGKFHSHVDKVLKDYSTEYSATSGLKNFFNAVRSIGFPMLDE